MVNRTIGPDKRGCLTNRCWAWSRIRINRCWPRIYRRKGSKLVIWRALIHGTFWDISTLNTLMGSWWIRHVEAITVACRGGKTYLPCGKWRALKWLLVSIWSIICINFNSCSRAFSTSSFIKVISSLDESFSAIVFINLIASQIGSSRLLFRFGCLTGTNIFSLWSSDDISLSEVSTVGLLVALRQDWVADGSLACSGWQESLVLTMS